MLKAGRTGDNLTPHHIPSNAYIGAKAPGYTRDKGIAIMMVHLSPGAGGRHRQTLSYGQAPDLSFLPRSARAREVWDVRAIYRRYLKITTEASTHRSKAMLTKRFYLSAIQTPEFHHSVTTS